MKTIRILAALWGAFSLLCAQSEINVNSKYLVESVEISGGSKNQVSRGLRADMEDLVGKKLNQESLEKLAKRIRTELRARLVSPKVTRGNEPEMVAVLFEVKGRSSRHGSDLTIPKGLYHSRQGWTGSLFANVNVGDGGLKFGILSDGDEKIERFAGLQAGYEHRKVGTDRVRLGFLFSSYHLQWQPSTQLALANAPEVPGLYRTRQDFAPQITVQLAEPLTLTAGTSFQRFQTQFPAAHTEAANAVTSTLRYARQLEDADGNKHQFEAGYSLRAATKVFDTDFVYARHEVNAGYRYRRHRNQALVNFRAGRTTGTPPLFERFVLGNASTLRGWNKYDLDPLGGTRMAHGTLEYRYRGWCVFYDTGALWSETRDGEVKHSLGAGYRAGDGFFLTLAFPVRSGRAEPILTAGVMF